MTSGPASKLAWGTTNAFLVELVAGRQEEPGINRPEHGSARSLGVNHNQLEEEPRASRNAPNLGRTPSYQPPGGR